MIIDFHAHLDRDPITKVYDVDGLLKDMEENHIDRRVVSTFYGASMSAANDKIAELVRQYPDRLRRNQSQAGRCGGGSGQGS